MATGDIETRPSRERNPADAAAAGCDEDRFRAIFDQSTAGIAEIDLTGRFVLANRRYCEIVGRAEDELLALRMQDISHPDDLPRNLPLFEQGVRGGESYSIEKRYLRPDGSVVWVNNSVSVVRNSAGEPTGLLAVCVDITQRREAEQALCESENRFSRFMQHLPGLAWIKDAGGRYVYANAAASKAFGRPADQLFGRTDEEVFPPETAHQFRAHDRRALQTASGVQIVETLEHEDGAVHHALVTKFPIPGPDDEPALVGGMAIDITDRLRAQEELRKRNEHLRLALEAGRMGTWDWDIRTGAITWSEGTGALHGLEEGGFDGTLEGFARLIHPDDRDAVNRAIASAIQTRTLYEAEFRIVWPDGSVHWMLGKGQAFYDADGPTHMVGIGIDVTARKLAEAAHAQSEERLRALTDNLPSGFIYQAVKDEDGLGRFTYVSAGVERLFGLTPAQVADDSRALYGLVHPEDAPRLMEAEERAVLTGTPFDCEFRARTVAGGPLWVHGRSAPRRLPDGETVWEGVLLDVTDRKRLTEALETRARELAELQRTTAESLALLDTIFAGSPVGYAYLDRDLRYRRINAALAEMNGRPAESHVGRAVREILPDYAPLAEPILRRVLETGEPVLNQEAIGAAPPGADFPSRHFLVSFYPVRDARGEIGGVGVAAVEVTQQKRAEGILREADRRKDEFLAMLAHELRNPLAPIRSGIDLLGMGKGSPEIIDLMRQQVMHLIRLVDDLLDVSRIMRGRIELRREPVELARVVSHAIDTARPLIDGQQHRLTQSLPPEPVWLDADPVRLAQVLANLLNNAAKYTDRGGHVQLTAERRGDEVLIRVRDDGVGMDPDLVPRVFDLFTQGDRSLDRSQGGLGIGLTVVRSLVEMHGGGVSADSDGPGRGSEFTVRLPALPAAPHAGISTPETAATAGRRILVVDDNVAAAKMLALLLAKFGDHEIRLAHDGPSALDAARARPPDLILLDIGLPRMDGYGVARRLRAEEATAATLLVALTGYGTAEDRRRSHEAGFDEHLVKPPAVEDLRRLFDHAKLRS